MEGPPTRWKMPNSYGKTWLRWGLQKRRVTFLKNITYFTESSSSLGFVFCPENSSLPSLSPDAWFYLQKSRKKSILQRMLSGDGKLAGETLPTLNCLKPSAEREAGIIVSGMSAMERKQKWRQNYTETALETNLRLGNTIPSTRSVLMFQWIIIYFYNCTAE